MATRVDIEDKTNRANPLIEWKIYYHDPDAKDYYSTFSNIDGTAEEAPVYGVILIQHPILDGRAVGKVSGADYYALDEEKKWIGMDALGLQDRIDNSIPFSALKQGRWINLERYWDILYLADDDKDFRMEPEGRTTRLPVVEAITRS